MNARTGGVLLCVAVALLLAPGVASAADVPADVAPLMDDCDPIQDPDCDGPEPPEPTGEKCPAVTAAPPTTQRLYRCQFTITDAYGRPAAGAPVRIESRWCNKNGTRVQGEAFDVTDALGQRTLSVSLGSGNQLECGLAGGEPAFGGPTFAVRKQSAALPGGTQVALTTSVQPLPTVTLTPAGLEAGNGRADLYQSGSYDKALVIAEQFDQVEHGPFSRDRRRFWKQLSALLTNLFSNGWDVWLVQPHDTGESLHEQSAELAQAISGAIARYNSGTRFTPICQSPTVGVLGFNTGGLVARIATARWEADAAWRTQLGLSATLPVKFLATFDAPHYGMHLNLDMQKTVWSNQSHAKIHAETNLDSCAASQVLRGRWDALRGQKTNADFLNFFVRGTPARFFSKLDNTEHQCAAGPAVATLNAARGVPGWPSTPIRLGFTQSTATDRIKCAGGTNLNGSGQNLCKYVNELSSAASFTPSAGQTWLRFYADDPSLPDYCSDQYWNAEDRVEWSDITPGSHSTVFLDGYVDTITDPPGVYCVVYAHQRFPTTLVPFVSAAGTQGPVGSSNYAVRPSPFHELYPAFASRPADVINIAEAINMVNRMNAFSPGCTAPVIQP